MISRESVVALRYRNFRLIWIGLLFSFTGSMMQTAAILWHVSLLVPSDRKALALGLVGLARVGPIVVFSMIGGVVADAQDRRRLMLATQIGLASVATLLAVLTFGGLSVVWPIYLLAALSSAVGAFDLPARHALIPMLVPREHLANALSLGTIVFQAGSVAGPALSGILIATTNVGWVYVCNAISFLFVILALLLMRDVPPHPEAEPGAENRLSIKAGLEGLRFVFRAPIIRSTMLLDFFATFFSSATALLPIFAQDVLHVGARGYGWLAAAPAVGAVVTSAALVPMIERIEHRGQTLLWSIAGYGVATIVFGLSRAFWLTFVCLALVGATDTVSTVIRNIVRQLETPDRLRGRMVGVNMAFFVGGPQLGEFEAGAVANWLGAQLSVVTGGIGCLIATIALSASTPMLRHYRKSTAAPPQGFASTDGAEASAARRR